MPLTTDDLHDFIRLVEAHPEWRTELRRLVLTDELLSLPEHVAALAEAQRRTEAQVAALTGQVTTLAEAQRRTEAQVTTLAEAQRRTEVQVAALTDQVTALVRSIQTLTDDVGTLKGKMLEADYRTKGPAYFSRVVRRPHVLTSDELVALVEDARDRGVLSDTEADEIYDADVVVQGRRREDGALVYLVVEVSWGVGPHDVERAVRRAALLARAGVTALPAVAGARVTADARHLTRTHKVWQVIDGYAIPPEPLTLS